MPTFPSLRALAPRIAPLALAAFASCVRAPAESPSPVRPGETAPAPSTNAPVSARRWTIVRAPATHAWTVETVAFVEVAPDTATPPAPAATRAPGDTTAIAPVDTTPRVPARDSVRSVASFAIGLADTVGGLAVRGTLDSLVVLSPRAPARRPILAPVPVAGLLDTVAPRLSIVGEADSAAACTDPSRGASLLVRDVVIALPRSLEPGQRWNESTVTVTCRADVPVTNRATHEYTVVALEDRGGVPMLAVRRTTRASLSGSATLRGSAVSIAGESKGESTLSVDPRDGRLYGSTGTSTTRLTITADGSSREVQQTATTRVTLQP
jgi:hypothetical protein